MSLQFLVTALVEKVVEEGEGCKLAVLIQSQQQVVVLVLVCGFQMNGLTLNISNKYLSQFLKYFVVLHYEIWQCLISSSFGNLFYQAS